MTDANEQTIPSRGSVGELFCRAIAVVDRHSLAILAVALLLFAGVAASYDHSDIPRRAEGMAACYGAFVLVCAFLLLASIAKDQAAPLLERHLGLRQRDEWNDASERLPDVGERVLILWDCCEHEIAWRLEDSWNVLGKCIPTNRVTHWMPLPAPPGTSE